MKAAGAILFVSFCAMMCAYAFAQTQPRGSDKQQATAPARAGIVDVYVDAGPEALAAYQVTLTSKVGRFKILGVEGGEHPAFAKPPYFDPTALGGDRIILAAFHTGAGLPKGRTRVARVHVQALGEVEPHFAVQLEAAASEDGGLVPATASWRSG